MSFLPHAKLPVLLPAAFLGPLLLALANPGVSSGAEDAPAEQVSGAENPKPVEVFAALGSMLRRFQTVEYDETMTGEVLVPRKGTQNLRQTSHLRIKGEWFWNDVRIENLSTKFSKEGTYVYKKDMIQHLDPSTSILVSDLKPTGVRPYTVQQPLTLLLEFAFEPDEYQSFERLKDPKRWERLASRSKVVGKADLLGFTCWVVELVSSATPSKAPAPAKTTLFLAEKLSFYPLKVIQTFSDQTTTRWAESLKTYETSDGEVVLPLEITSEVLDKSSIPLLKQAFGVAPDSVRINHPLDDDRDFTIPKSQASFYWNRQKKSVERNTQFEPKGTLVKDSHRKLMMVLWLNLTVAVLVFLWIRKARKKND